MNLTITPVKKDKHLLLVIRGEWYFENSASYLEEILSIYNQHKSPLVIDIRKMTSNTSVFDDYHDIDRFIEQGFIQIGKVALLDHFNRKIANDFFETSATNRGLNFKFFYTEQEAIDWLLKNY